ncbi:MAG TPA: tRNA uridine(34) 5-carboxymethylaminomethyl modification radical SAM/GNAT enzyme Elp3 [archaeon]|nr:tRNA uridine(34) 5-carboxymethylaminomethyl modification radical SAM/GNAT enzyme Elp3 [archaeon]
MNAKARQFSREIINAIESGEVKDKQALDRLKLSEGKKLRLSELPSNPDILMQAQKPSQAVAGLLSIKPLRTLSGVAPVAVMTKPINCPHGTCIYCPGGPNSVFGNVPQSYTGHEPATMRGINNNYDSYLQAMNRIYQYFATGHKPEKLELIVMGGTFPATPLSYQEEFISGAFQAANDFSSMFFAESKFDSGKFNKFFSMDAAVQKEKLLQMKEEQDVAKQHARNENADIRIVTMCIETKPDWCKQKEIDGMLELGTTRVEIGVQSLYEDVLKFTHRGHTLQDTIEATRLLKDSGLKATYHMMPGQPLSSREKDIDMFRKLFENPDYRPDGLKIYPCMVMPGTALSKLYESGKFTPLGTEEAAEIIAEAKRYFPEYTRVHRIQRDIPTKFSLGGIDKNNLRQIVEHKLAKKGLSCRCIRCRESGINSEKGREVDYDAVELVERKYDASGGEEVFISYEHKKNDLILGFCRLRMPSEPFRKEFTADTACIRELHVFGAQVGLGDQKEESSQHRGFGKKLVERAEQIAQEQFGARKMLVISGVGAREYYSQKLGYARDGAYMGKKLI